MAQLSKVFGFIISKVSKEQNKSLLHFWGQIFEIQPPKFVYMELVANGTNGDVKLHVCFS